MISLLIAIISVFFYLRKKYFHALLLFFFLFLNGFQVIPLEILTYGSFSGSTIDSALVAFLILFFLRGRYWLKHLIVKTPIAKIIFVFVFFLILNSLYGLIIQGYSFGDVFKGSRLYFFILSFLMFTEVPVETIERVIKVLVVITFFQSILFVLQIVTGKTLLQGPKELEQEDVSFTRFYNGPMFLDFSMATVLFWNPFKKLKWLKWMMIFVFACTIIGPLNRGILFAWFFSVALFSILFNSFDKKVIYIALIVVLGVGVLSIPMVQRRLDEATEQLGALESISSGKPIMEDNTFTYRVNHLSERLAYINSLPAGWLFGIGLVDERAPQVNALPLKFGLPDLVTGRITKVYTPDIAWSLLLLTMGYIGTLLYVFIFAMIIRQFAGDKTVSEVSKMIFVLIILSLTASFTSNTFSQPVFFVPILMLIVVVSKYKFINYKRALNKR